MTLGSTEKIDYRTRVGTDAWKKRNSPQARKLSAWRRLHALLPHDEVKKIANLDMTWQQLAKIVAKVEADEV
ncbi:MAG: hypothetical protein ACYS7Y_04400 [Planctomycetota bacterium]|jgi:hypothetical protein